MTKVSITLLAVIAFFTALTTISSMKEPKKEETRDALSFQCLRMSDKSVPCLYLEGKDLECDFQGQCSGSSSGTSSSESSSESREAVLYNE